MKECIEHDCMFLTVKLLTSTAGVLNSSQKPNFLCSFLSVSHVIW